MSSDGTTQVRLRARNVLLFTVAATVLVAIIHAAVLGHLTARSATRAMEEEDRFQTGMCVQQQVGEHFGDSLFEALRNDGRRQETAEALLKVMRRHGAFRIKVYDENGVVLWSDEPQLIGRSFPDNYLLQRALTGEIVSKIERPNRTEHVYERGSTNFVTETYVPIRSGSGKLLGVVEVYRRSDETVARLDHVRNVVWGGAAVAIVILGATLSLIVGLGNRRIFRLQDQIRQRGNELAHEKSKLDAVVQGMGVGLCLVRPDRRIEWANRVMEQWTGAVEGLVDRICYQACWGREAPCEDCPLSGTLDDGRESGVERRWTGPDGRERHFQISAWPVRDGSGRITHCLELVQDVTERALLHIRMQQAAKLVAIGELAGGVAHEVNNPTGVILATATHLLERVPPEFRDDLALVASNADRISRITGALLAFSRRSKGERRSISLNRIVEECLPLVRRLLNPRTELSVETAPALSSVLVNANEIQQVLINLVSNACDAMPEGGTLRISTRADGPDRVAFEVADTGCGISPEHLDRIFDPFFTTKPPGKGTGLGLAVSQGIVAAHGGRISVTSAPGKGSVFMAELPAAREAAR